MSEIEKYNHYGALITVAALLLLVVYSAGPYDGWDLFIALMATWFGCFYLHQRVFFDCPSRFLGSFIAVAGASIAVVSIVEIVRFFAIEQGSDCALPTCPSDGGGISWLLVVILVLTCMVYYLLGRRNG